ncbi:MAG TPA: type II secretion system F family protein [Cellvibrio sp.]|nr:type II secretion system F family protein [Cellvibrio sp.]
MATFQYRGRSADGQLVSGQIDSANTDGVVTQLLARGVTPVSIEEYQESQSLGEQFKRITNARRVDNVELIMFCRQMYTITKSGIPLIKGLHGIASSLRNAAFRQALNDVIERLETGAELSLAMRAHPRIFDNLMVSMISVGENSGRLELVFQQLGEYMARDLNTIKSIKTALRYPAIVLSAIAIALVIINVKVIPAFAGMFAQFGADLPLPTKILLGISDFFVDYWVYMLVGLVGAFIWVNHFVQSPQGSRWWGAKKLRLMVVGDVIERASLARYARSFGLMFSAGLPITTSLELCARAIDNPYLADKIRSIRAGIERGETIHQTHLASGMFTPLVLQMIAVGEESGQVDTLLTEVAEFYEREIEYDIKLLGDRMEPVIIIIMAIFVTILALGIFLPIWDMYSAQKH